MNRKIIIIVILLACLAIGWYGFNRNRTAGDTVLRTTGTVEGTEVNITSKVNGRIAMLNHREGESVAVGAILMTLENDDLAAQIKAAEAGIGKAEAAVLVAEATVVSLKAGVETAAARVGAARADLAKSRVQALDAGRQLERQRQLYKQNIVAREVLDGAETTRDAGQATVAAAKAQVEAATAGEHSAKAQLDMAESQVGQAKAGVSQARAELAYQQAKLAETTVSSPIYGTVVYRGMEAGETVVPGMTALTLVDLDHLTVRVDIDESRLGTINPGAKAVIRLDDRPHLSFTGKVAAINRYADFATQRDVAAGRQDIRTFRVTIALTPGTTGLNPGMTVRVDIPPSPTSGSHD